jgi:hypothetical protein
VTNFASEGVNIDEVSVARTADGTLHILWTQGTSVLNTRLSSDGQTILGTSTVFTYEGAVGDVELLRAGAGLRAFFAGLSAGDQAHDGGLSTATSGDGITWAVQPTLASETDSGNEQSPVYAAAGVGGTHFNNGVPMSVWGVASPGTQGYHIGTDPSTPDVRFGGAITVYDPDAATDSATGAVAIGWNDSDAERTQVAFVQPTTSPWFPLGAPATPPGAEAPDAQYPVGITGRSGGADGIYVSYLRGTNPFTSQPAVWRVGAGNAATLSNGEARYPGIAMGPDGRLWTFWEDDNTAEVHARRSNPAADAWGADVAIDPPGSTTWSLKGEGTGLACGALDLLALASNGDDLANYHQRILPGLTLTKEALNGNEGRKAKVRFTTLDADAPLDATVQVGNKQKTTGADGTVKFKIKRKRRTRKVRATASNVCFNEATLRVKIKKRPAE